MDLKPSDSLRAWIDTVITFERTVRVSASVAFGLALVAAALALRQQSRAARQSDGLWPKGQSMGTVPWPSLSHAFYVLGTVLVASQVVLVAVMPQASWPMLMSLGLVALVSTSVLAIDLDRDKRPVFTFITGALVWLVLVLSPFLELKDEVQPRTALSGIGRFHIVAAIVAQSLFVVGCVTSGIYIFVHRRLRQKRLVSGSGLPSLDTLYRLCDRVNVLGLLIMTSSLVAGLILTYQGHTLGQDGWFKLVWAFGVWFWYVTAVFGRVRLGWRGYRGAVVSVIGGALLGLALFGTVWGT
jgi:ABC-type uncharacterized transport system permease subunit